MSESSSQATLEQMSREDLLRVAARDRFVKGQQDNRIALLIRENLELLAIVQEQQSELALMREQQEAMQQALRAEEEKRRLETLPEE